MHERTANGETGNRRRIARAAGIIGIASLFVYAFAFLREVITGMRFGATANMDALLVASAVPLLVAGVVSAIVQTTVVPFYARTKQRQPELLRGLIGSFSTVLLLTLVTLTLLLAVASPLLMRWMGSGFTEPQRELALHLIWFFLPVIPFLGMFGLVAGLLNAEKVFWAPAVLPGIAALITAVFIWFGGMRWGVFSLAAGFTLGSVVQSLAALVVARRRGVGLHLLRPNRRSPVWGILRMTWPIALGAVCTGLIIVIDRKMASTLATGSIAALGYADKLNALALGFAGSIQAAAYPFFAEQAGRDDRQRLAVDFSQTVRLVVFLLAPVSLVIIFLNRPIVRLVFQRGMFDATATAATGDALIGYAVGLVPLAAGLVVARMAQAVQRFHLVGYQGVANPVLKLALNALLIPLLGHAGVSLGTSLMYLIGLMVLLAGIRSSIPEAFGMGKAGPYLRMSVGLAGLVAILFLFRPLVGAMTHGLWANAVAIAVPAAAALGIYWGVCHLLGVEEARAGLRILRRLRA